MNDFGSVEEDAPRRQAGREERRPAAAPEPQPAEQRSLCGEWRRLLCLQRADLEVDPAYGRIRLLDVARGMFILWMIIGHALTLARVPLDHPLQWLRPRGWATTSFVMLTGFSIAVVYRWRAERARRIFRALWARGLTIGCVALISNVVFKLLRAVLFQGCTMEYVFNVLTFQGRWSISAILIPTTAVLFVAPALVWLTHRVGPVLLFLVSTAGIAAILTFVERILNESSGDGLLNTFFGSGGNFGFPLGGFFLLSIWSFSFGNLLRSTEVRRHWPLLVAGSLAVILLARGLDMRPVGLQWVIPLLRFGVSLAICLVLVKAKWAITLRAALTNLGRTALLIFIVHRPLLQIERQILQPSMNNELLALLSIVLTVSLCYWLSVLRHENRAMAAGLGWMGF